MWNHHHLNSYSLSHVVSFQYHDFTHTKQNFVSKLSCLLEGLNQSESVVRADILMTIGGTTKASFYEFTADCPYFQVGFSVPFRSC